MPLDILFIPLSLSNPCGIKVNILKALKYIRSLKNTFSNVTSTYQPGPQRFFNLLLYLFLLSFPPGFSIYILQETSLVRSCMTSLELGSALSLLWIAPSLGVLLTIFIVPVLVLLLKNRNKHVHHNMPLLRSWAHYLLYIK